MPLSHNLTLPEDQKHTHLCYVQNSLQRYKFKGTNINITLLKLKSSTKLYAEMVAVNTVTATQLLYTINL